MTLLRNTLAALVLLLASLNGALALSPGAMQQLEGRQAIEWRGIVIDLNMVMPFYEANGFLPIWLEGNRPNARAQALVNALSAAHEDGLVPSDYLPRAFGDLSAANESDALGLELALSDAFMAYARDLHSGRTTPAVSEPDIVIARKDADPLAWLSAVAARGVEDAIQSLRPQHRQYFQLKQMLGGYRALAGRGGWPLVIEGEVLKPGMRSAALPSLRANLTARGYSGLNAADPEFYDDGLVAVVEHFQKRHGLDTDGVVGPATYRALNITADERVRQIIVNMERWRWLPKDLGQRHVFVNQAAFEMFLVDGGRTIDTRRVIVGKPFHKTPIFSDRMEYAEFNPTWTAPQSIAVNELLPKLRNDPSFTEVNNYSIYSGWSAGASRINPYMVDWSAVNPKKFPYRIVQEPGPKNALGQVKFIFPNKFDVYLHDTPSRQLFAKTGRAFSHGCIRVNKPLEFAALLFGIDQGLGAGDISRIVDSKQTRRVSLKSRVDVHLTYFSTWVDDNGVPYFHEDVYERDKLVGRLLFGNV